MKLKPNKRVYWDGISGINNDHYDDRTPQIVTCYKCYSNFCNTSNVWDVILDKNNHSITVMPEHLFSLKEKKVTIYAFDSKANVEKYNFYGNIDYERLERENILEGNKIAYVVKRNKEITRYIPKDYDMEGWYSDETNVNDVNDDKIYVYRKVKGWICNYPIETVISDIKKEILKNNQKIEILTQKVILSIEEIKSPIVTTEIFKNSMHNIFFECFLKDFKIENVEITIQAKVKTNKINL